MVMIDKLKNKLKGNEELLKEYDLKLKQEREEHAQKNCTIKFNNFQIEKKNIDRKVKKLLGSKLERISVALGLK